MADGVGRKVVGLNPVHAIVPWNHSSRLLVRFPWVKSFSFYVCEMTRIKMWLWLGVQHLWPNFKAIEANCQLVHNPTSRMVAYERFAAKSLGLKSNLCSFNSCIVTNKSSTVMEDYKYIQFYYIINMILRIKIRFYGSRSTVVPR